jgi:hypothetical protein
MTLCPMLQELRGEILALDQATGLLTLKQPGSTPFHSNLRILRIQDVQVSIASFDNHSCALALHVYAVVHTTKTQPGHAPGGRGL